MTKREPKKHVSELAAALSADPSWAGSLLARYDVPVDEDGYYETAPARQAFDKGAAALSSTSHEYAGALLASSEMGPDEDSCRRWLRARFLEHRVKVIGSSGPRLTLEREDGARMWITAYVALSVKENGQLGFSASGLNETKIPWVALIAKPWGRAFLRRREEIREGLKNPEFKKRGVAFLTVGPGSTKNFFSERIEALVSTDKDWDLHREGARRGSK